MTERPTTSAPPPREARRSHLHPLLRPFPLTVLALATFLVVFTFMMASLRSTVPALAPGTAVTKIVSAGGRRHVVKTTPSGRLLASGGAGPSAGPASAPAAGTPVVTSPSGGNASDD